MTYLLLIVGLVLIIAGANYLTEGASALARRLRMSDFLIGLTIVAIGTSMPELIVSLLSALDGKTDMALGNVIGSNLFNGFVILGLCALIRPIPYTRDNIRRDIPFGIVAALLLIAAALPFGAQGSVVRGEGIVLLLAYAAFMYVTIRGSKQPEPAEPAESAGTPAEPKADAPRPMALWLTAVLIVGGLAALVGGGELVLDSAVKIARSWGVSDAFISITLLAGGTSLPELASSIASLVKGRSAMALGNVIGSNITNILLILGLSAAAHPLSTTDITTLDFGMLLASAVLLLLTAFAFRRAALDRVEGALFLVIYLSYIALLLR